MKKILNLTLVIVSEYQNTKTFLLKDARKIGLRKFLLLAKLRIQFLGLMLLVILMVNQLEKKLKRKGDKLYVKWKG